MAVQHSHPEHDHGPVVSEAATVREPFGVGQILALAIGVFFVVIGAVGLARAGTDTLTGSRAEVTGLSMTMLLALLHLAIGVVALVGAAGRYAARSSLMFIGPVLVAAGVIALIQRIDALGWNETNGIAYLICGGVAIVAAMLTPLATVSRRDATVV